MGVQLLGRTARRVLAFDTVAERRALAAELGATAALDPRSETGALVEVVRRHLPELPGVVLEVSGTQPGLETALAIVRPKGRVALVGSQQRLDRFDLFWPLQNSGARIVPIFREGPASVQSAAGSPVARFLPLVHEMLVRGWLRIEPLISWVVPPEAATRAMDLLHRRPDLAIGMAVAWDESQVRGLDAFERAWALDRMRPA
jgi:threonine dehydrogenase-like Zn-dependent dehydrogenase